MATNDYITNGYKQTHPCFMDVTTTCNMPIEFAQIISTLDQRPDTTDPTPVYMDQNDAIFGIGHSIEHPADINIESSAPMWL